MFSSNHDLPDKFVVIHTINRTGINESKKRSVGLQHEEFFWIGKNV